MTHSFAITTETLRIRPGRDGRALAVFTVSACLGRPTEARVVLRPQGQMPPEWLTVVGQADLHFNDDDKLGGGGVARSTPETRVVRVEVAVPPGVAPGQYTFRICVANVASPDEDYAEGQLVAVDVAAPELVPAPRSRFWPAAGIAVAAVAAVGWAMTAIEGHRWRQKVGDLERAVDGCRAQVTETKDLADKLAVVRRSAEDTVDRVAKAEKDIKVVDEGLKKTQDELKAEVNNRKISVDNVAADAVQIVGNGVAPLQKQLQSLRAQFAAKGDIPLIQTAFESLQSWSKDEKGFDTRLDAKDREGVIDLPVTFAKGYAERPEVVLGLRRFTAVGPNPTEPPTVVLSAHDITLKGFTLRIFVHKGTNVNTVEVVWLAVGSPTGVGR